MAKFIFFLHVFMDQDGVDTINMQNLESGEYPTILSRQKGDALEPSGS